MELNLSGPINNLLLLDLDKPLDCLVGLPIVKDGKVVGRIESVSKEVGMWHGTIEEDVGLIFPEACSMEIRRD